MKASHLKALLILLLMVVAFSGAQAWRPKLHLADTRVKVDLETQFPRAFAGWVIDDRMSIQLVSPDVQQVLNKIYNQTLSRTYVNSLGERIMLSVAYGGDQSDATRAHRPEVCYPAQGFQVMSSQVGELSIQNHRVRVRRLVAKQGARIEPITYWLTVGNRVAISGTEQKLAQLAYSTRGVIPDGMLVRVSSIDDDVDRAYLLHQTFVAEMVQALPRGTSSQVIGNTGT